MKTSLLVVALFAALFSTAGKTPAVIRTSSENIFAVKNIGPDLKKYKIKINHTFTYAGGCSITITGTLNFSCCFSGSFSGSVTISGNCSGTYPVNYSSKGSSDFLGSDQTGVISNEWKTPTDENGAFTQDQNEIYTKNTLNNNSTFQSDFISFISATISASNSHE